jgi:hypothetical protein
MNRRNFISTTALFLSSLNLFAKDSNNADSFKVEMFGALDDDLIINRYYYGKEEFKPITCYQMHNFTRSFLIGSQKIKSVQIPGFIKYDKNINVDENSVVAIFTANEREDRDPRKKLTFRTHYKSVPLYVNDKELFPSIIPEDDDVPGYPTWYGEDEENMSNYYKLWENAVVFTGLITHVEGETKIALINEIDEVIGDAKVFISKNEMKKIEFKNILNHTITNKHVFTELDNKICIKENDCDDKFIKKNGVTKIMITNKKGTIVIDLPYPCPYVNTYYIKHINKGTK